MSNGPITFGVTSGMRGFFAVMCDDHGPINSGIGSYKDSKGAAQEAAEWAEAEGFPLEADKLRKRYEL